MSAAERWFIVWDCPIKPVSMWRSSQPMCLTYAEPQVPSLRAVWTNLWVAVES